MRFYPAVGDRQMAQAVIARACVRHAFDQGIERVVAIVHRDNLASQQVARRAGLHLEQELDIAGRPHHIYATAVAPEPQRSP